MKINTKHRLVLLTLAFAISLGSYFYVVAFPQESTQAQVAPVVAGQVLGAQSPFRGELVQPSEASQEPVLSNLNSTAKSFLIYNQESGEILAQKNPDLELPIASLTKLMTAWLVYQQGNLSDTVSITTRDKMDVAPILNLKLGDQIKVADLFNSMLVGSENDAALTLSHYLEAKTGTDFASLMNQAAKDLGMVHTHFSNALGFDTGENYSTAKDLAVLIQQTRGLGAFVNLGRTTQYSFQSYLGNTYNAKATNKLIGSHPEIEAIKTGYTNFSLGSMATEVTFGDQHYIVIVLGSQDRESDTLNAVSALKDNRKF